jgi:hypothetical protein
MRRKHSWHTPFDSIINNSAYLPQTGGNIAPQKNIEVAVYDDPRFYAAFYTFLARLRSEFEAAYAAAQHPISGTVATSNVDSVNDTFSRSNSDCMIYGTAVCPPDSQ